MIGITISGKARAAMASTLPTEQDISSNGEYLIWLPQQIVERLLALRQPGETFSDVILQKRGGSFASITR